MGLTHLFMLQIQSEKMKSQERFLVWIDMEFSGLNIETDRILEVAAIITDMNLNKIDTFGPIAIKQKDQLLDNMDEWCTNTFNSTGLTKRVRESKITEKQCEQSLLKFIKKHVPRKYIAYIAGNSVHVDKKYLDKYFVSVKEYLSYRIVDVSSISILEIIFLCQGDQQKYRPTN